jgi:hypothetical protein
MLGGDTEAKSVTLAGVPAFVSSASASTISLIVADSANTGSGDVIITALSGALVSLADGFAYKTASEIADVNPAAGQLGTVVTVTGAHLRGSGANVTKVTLAGVEANIQSESNTVIIVVAASGANQTGDVVVVADSGALATASSAFLYTEEGQITDVSPASGQLGTVVVLTGTNLRGNGDNITQVKLGDAVAEIVEENNTHIVLIATEGPSDASDVDVVITANTGAYVTAADGFKYLQPGEVLLVDPEQGQVGTEVVITGDRMCGGGDEIVTVTLCGLEAQVDSGNCNLVKVTANELGAQVTGDVVLVSDTGSVVTGTNAFEYLGVGNITSVYPSAGQGTTTVTIQGANLLGGGSEAVSVSLCGVVAQIIEGKNNDTYMVVRANSGPVSVGAATGNVVIESDTGVKITAINRFTYSTVTAIAPELGQGGTVVTITGIALLGDGRTVQTVTLDGEEVEEVLSSSSTEIVVIASAIGHEQDQTGTAVITLDNDETVESVAGRNDELTHTFTYTVPGAVTSVSPARGQLNTVVTIVGTELFGQGSYLVNVTLAGVAAQIVNQSNTEVIVIASASDGTNVGTVELTSDTGAVVSVSDAWKYVNVGDVTGVSPNNGQLNTLITITGTDLMAGGNGLVAVSLAGVAVKELVSNSSTEVVVVAAISATAGAGDILFESENGASVLLEDGFTYVAVPNITDVSPAVGQTNTIVTISGTGLFAGAENITTVTLNNVDAEILSRSDDQVIVQAANGAGAGVGDIQMLTTSGATVLGEQLFTYNAEGDITGVSPSSGQGDTVVQIDGTNLFGHGSATTVTLGGAAVKSTTSSTNTQIVVVVAAGNPGTGDVLLVADTGATVTEASGWKQLEEGAVTAVEPANGHVGTEVVVTGERLLAGADDLSSVFLAGVEATYEAGTATDDEVTVIAAASATAGSGDVVLTASSGATITAGGAFTYESAGDVSGIVPTSGQYATSAVITGTGLLAGGDNFTSITLDGVEVLSIESFSDTEVEVIADSSTSAGTGAIVFTVNTGAVVTSSANVTWTYVEPQNIASVTPSNAQYGTVVAIGGTSMLGGGDSADSVTLAGVDAAEIVFSNDSLVIVTIRNSTAATGAIVITADSGAIVTSANDAFTYVANGVVEQVSPALGQERSPVTISGQRLLGGGSAAATVTLAGLEAEVNSSSATEIVVFAARSPNAVVGDIVIVADSGAIVSLTNGWEYIAPGVVTDVSPAKGQQGTEVTISGSLLLGSGTSAAFVSLAGIEASVESSNAATVVVTAAASAEDVEDGDIKIVSNSGVQLISSESWSYFKNGFVTGVEPSSGVEGTQVFIYGNDLRGQSDDVVSVTLSGVAASITRQTNAFVNVVAQAGNVTGAAGAVVLTSITGAVITEADGWTYVTAGNITEVEPSSAAASSNVVIRGTNFLAGATAVEKVTLANVEASIISQNDTNVKVEVGLTDKTDGFSGDVVMTTDTGSVITLESGFSYIAKSDIHSVTPSVGQYGTRVVIKGEELLSGADTLASITLAGEPVASVEKETASEIVVIAAASTSAKVGDIVLNAGNGAALERSDGWTYVAPAVVSAATPNEGQLGTSVVITGSDLLAGGNTIVSLWIAGTAVSEIVSSNNSHVEIVVPAENATDTANGTIRMISDTGGIVVSDAGAWTYLSTSTITAISPNNGQIGTTVTIDGADLRGGGWNIVSVTLAGVAATIVNESDSQIIVTADRGTNGTGHVVVTANTGAHVTAEGAFTYLKEGRVESLAPTVVQYNTEMTIVGQRLLGGGASVESVTIDGCEVKSITAYNDTHITVVVADKCDGNRRRRSEDVPVVVTSNTGSIIVLSVSGVTYNAKGEINSVTPTVGVGGSVVVVKGSSLLASGTTLAKVTLSGVEAEITAQNDTVVVLAAAVAASGNVGDVVFLADTGGTITKSASWQYLEPGTVASVTPAEGQVGTTVVIEGTSLFAGGASIATIVLDGTEVASIAAGHNNTYIEVVVARADESAAVGDIVLTSDIGTVLVGENVFSYLAEGDVADVSPNSGRVGTTATITGSGLRGGGDEILSVTLGGATATIDSENASYVAITVPDGDAEADGEVDIVMTSDSGAVVTEANGWTFVKSNVTSVSPSQGQLGVVVTLSGTNLLGGGSSVDITFGGVDVLEIISLDNSEIVVRVADAAAGQSTVTLTADTGAVVAQANGFEYLEASDIASVTPNAGQFSTRVTIAGTSLLGEGAADDDTIVSARLGTTKAEVVLQTAPW